MGHVMSVFDPRICALGEGPLWHPERGQLFWFDILGKRLLSRMGEHDHAWQFDAHVSAAGWIDRRTLLVASESTLFRFDIETGQSSDICPLEAGDATTRSNDGRADPWGGFWIGTMGKSAAPGAGAIYRFYKGKLTRLFSEITIPNAICFSPDRARAYFTDTPRQQIMVQGLDATGWPEGAPELFVDLAPEGLMPDGAVVDAEGCLWNAQWGAGRVARYAPDGRFLSAIDCPASQTTCPAFGGPDLSTLFVTSAADNLAAPKPTDGQTFQFEMAVGGTPESMIEI